MDNLKLHLRNPLNAIPVIIAVALITLALTVLYKALTNPELISFAY